MPYWPSLTDDKDLIFEPNNYSILILYEDGDMTICTIIPIWVHIEFPVFMPWRKIVELNYKGLVFLLYVKLDNKKKNSPFVTTDNENRGFDHFDLILCE